MVITKDSLLEFIATAHRHTYAAPKEIKNKYKCKIPIQPGHKDYDFIDGIWRYHDSYAGRIWAPGKEVVFFNEKPVWTMSYQGKVKEELPWTMSYQGRTEKGLSEEFIENMYSFLKKSLMNFDDKQPFRGPPEFREHAFEYSFSMEGDFSYFTGKESITYEGEEVFFQDVMGCLIK